MKIRHPIKPLVIKPKSYIPHLIAIAALWAAAMTLDYSNQMENEREAATRAAEIYESRIKILDFCEQKKITGYYRGDTPYACPHSLGAMGSLN